MNLTFAHKSRPFLKRLMALLPLWFLACSTSGAPSAPQDTNTVYVSKTISVGIGKDFDGLGKLYEWVGKGDCSQTEGMPPMFKVSAGAKLRNLQMKNAPDGIHIAGSNVILDNITNLDVCEDAISIKLDKNKRAPQNILIINSKFFDCEDKAIQITRGSNILIAKNEFHRCAKAIRVKEKATDIRFEQNKVYQAKVAVKVTGGNGSASDNLIDGAKVAFWAEKDGRFIVNNDNRVNNVTEIYRETELGKIIIEPESNR